MKRKLYLYLISQDVNNDYDTYDSAVVAASTRKEAQNTTIGGFSAYRYWADPKDVKVKKIGIAGRVKKGTVLASFNAG